MSSLNTAASSPVRSAPKPRLNLSRLREKNGISLEQIANQTKISIGFLRAIEAEEFEKLPGGLFATSYLRQYAALAGIDESDLLSQYSLRTGPSKDAPVPRKKPGSETRTWFGRWLGIAADTPR